MYPIGNSQPRETVELYTRSFARIASSSSAHSFAGAIPDIGIMDYQKGEFFKTFFQNGATDTNVTVIELVDGQESNLLVQPLPEKFAGMNVLGVQFPFMFNSEKWTEPLTFNLKDGFKGHRLSYIIKWNSNARLQSIELKTSDETPNVSMQQQERIYASNR
jgi:hypothetical protein